MTRLERGIWQRWNQYHKNTAEIAKDLEIAEADVERTIRKLRDERLVAPGGRDD